MVIGLKKGNVKYSISIIASVFTLVIVQFVEKWVWSPYWTLILFLIVLLLDYISAILLSFKNGGGFVTGKSRKFFYQVFAQVSALGLIFNFPKLNDVFGHEAVQPVLNKLPGALFMFMLSYNILSVVKNCTLLGGYNGKVAQFLKKYVDPHKNDPKE